MMWEKWEMWEFSDFSLFSMQIFIQSAKSEEDNLNLFVQNYPQGGILLLTFVVFYFWFLWFTKDAKETNLSGHDSKSCLFPLNSW